MIDQGNLEEIRYTIVGTLLRIPDSIGETVEALDVEDFGSSSTRAVYKTIAQLFAAGRPVDMVTVRHELGEAYEMVLRDAVDKRPLDPNELAYFRDLLKDMSRLLDIQVLASQIQGAARLEEVTSLVAKANELLCSRRSVQAVDAVSLVARYVARKHENRPPPEYIRFGMAELDDVLFVRRGDMVVIGGYASSGKTLLSLQFARKMAERYEVGYFSLETDDEDLSDRMIANGAQIELGRIKAGKELAEDIRRAEHLGMELAEQKGHLWFHQASGMSVQDVQAVALSRRYDIIFVDYLQILTGPERDFRERITNISIGLHTMAQRNKITVIALAQLARPERTKTGSAPPNMWSFKESGQIENDANVAMLLYPSDMNDNMSPRVLKVSKNKSGKKAQFMLDFDGGHQTLRIMPPSKAEKFRVVNRAIREATKARQAKTAETPDQVRLEDITEQDDGPLPF